MQRCLWLVNFSAQLNTVLNDDVSATNDDVSATNVKRSLQSEEIVTC